MERRRSSNLSASDEIVHVINGATLLRLRPDEGSRILDLGVGAMVVVPRGMWHRFEPATGVILMSITPLPIDHPPVDVEAVC
jgi:mannose-6-phosphate isomerase-like protein (cupin superfamily)